MNVRINAALDLFSLSVGAVSRRPRLSLDRSTTLTAVKTPGGFVHLDPASGAARQISFILLRFLSHRFAVMISDGLLIRAMILNEKMAIGSCCASLKMH